MAIHWHYRGLAFMRRRPHWWDLGPLTPYLAPVGALGVDLREEGQIETIASVRFWCPMFLPVETKGVTL